MNNEELNALFIEAVTDYNNKNFQQASEKFKVLLDYEPNNIVIWHNYGLSLISQDRFEEALVALELPIQKQYSESILSRGAALRSMGRYEEAMTEFSKCFILNATNTKAYSNYGNCLREFGMPEAALPYFDIALNADPDDPTYKLNQSVAYLLKGDLINGWKNYDGRWFYQSDVSFKPKLPGIEYDGTQDIAGKIVCVYCEQGFGDSIQFIRYVKILQEMGAKILLVTRPPLVDLFKYNFPDIEIRTEFNSLTYNFHVPLLDLPKCFNTSIDTIPYPTPYLSVSHSLIQSYKKLLGEKTKRRVGIVWSSNSIAFTTRFRQVSLELMLQKLSECDVEIVNLKFDATTEEKELLKKYNAICVDADGFNNVAALTMNLDLVVTVDTVHAHVAGALGVPVYVMIADYGMDWRWFLHRTDSPFYQSATVFRQHGDRDWAPVLDDIKQKILLDK